MEQNGRIENFVGSLVPRGLNQIRVGTDRRNILRTFNEISNEITYTGPVSPRIYISAHLYIYLRKNATKNVQNKSQCPIPPEMHILDLIDNISLPCPGDTSFAPL